MQTGTIRVLSLSLTPFHGTSTAISFVLLLGFYQTPRESPCRLAVSVGIKRLDIKPSLDQQGVLLSHRLRTVITANAQSGRKTAKRNRNDSHSNDANARASHAPGWRPHSVQRRILGDAIDCIRRAFSRRIVD